MVVRDNKAKEVKQTSRKRVMVDADKVAMTTALLLEINKSAFFRQTPGACRGFLLIFKDSCRDDYHNMYAYCQNN